MTGATPPNGAEERLQTTLTRIGETPLIAARLVAGLDEERLRRDTGDGQTCHALMASLVVGSVQLGRVAHEVLNHPPGAGDAVVSHSGQMTGNELLAQLRFLREHIVSTVAQQGAAVWFTPTPNGSPLLTHAEALAHQDEALLAELARAARRVHSREV